MWLQFLKKFRYSKLFYVSDNFLSCYTMQHAFVKLVKADLEIGYLNAIISEANKYNKIRYSDLKKYLSFCARANFFHLIDQ